MDIEKIAMELVRSGKIDIMKAMAESEEVKRLSERMDAAAVEKAAKSGDSDALRAIVSQLLGTSEGRRLAQQLNDALK